MGSSRSNPLHAPDRPQLYVKGEFVGGSDIMMEMFESGELQDILPASAARGEGDHSA